VAQTVTIDDDFFAPETVSVPVESAVEWIGGGNRQHTVTGTSSRWESGALQPGERFAVTFDAPGVYPYICAVHPGVMQGLVIVEAQS
jgi:plastocyanin